ncbi:MAG TPA: cofactor-independent phosphoglycerate mutase [Archaeoglobaceae archaeon]|nr:cofactor-independent phosphoglycerate mutase [Archaeoglobaceae archaeon]
MKYLLLIPDGMADWPIKKIGNKTPLEYADTPNMDFIAKEGACGTAKTVPDNFEPGSDIANMTILSIDPKKYYTGRGPIEALAKGVKGKIVFRCNLVYVEDGIMKDYSGRKITDMEARRIINLLNKESEDDIRFHTGRTYRNLLILNRDFSEDVKTTPPHDILGKSYEDYLPRGGELASLLTDLMDKSTELLRSEKANMIWPWGGGKMPAFPSFKNKWGINGVMISEVDLLQGIGKGIGFSVVEVEGATGYINTNYKGLTKSVLNNLKSADFIVLHTEGIDEAGHEGSLNKKIEGIELYDEKIVGYLLDRIDLEETRIMLLPDHPTPITVRTHIAEPIPFVYYGKKRDEVKSFSEKSCIKGLFGQIDGIRLMNILFS